MKNISAAEIELKLIVYVFESSACPKCEAESKRNTIGHRMLKDLSLEQPDLLVMTMGVYECPRGCRAKYFRNSAAIAERRSAYTDRVKETAIASVTEDNLRDVFLNRRDCFLSGFVVWKERNPEHAQDNEHTAPAIAGPG